MVNPAKQPVQSIKGIGPMREKQLAKLNILTVEDMLEHFPFRYEDRTAFQLISALEPEKKAAFTAQVVQVQNLRQGGKTLTKATVRDSSGSAELIWFNQPYKKQQLQVDSKLSIYGKVQIRTGIKQIVNPEVEPDAETSDSLHTGTIVPIYPTTDGLAQRTLRGLIYQAIEECDCFPETLPEAIIRQWDLMSRDRAIRSAHRPSDENTVKAALKRLAFEKYYFLQCGLLLSRAGYRRQHAGIKHAPDGRWVNQLESLLPFRLTNGQAAALDEIKQDMESEWPMQRLLQGDVGSGKTVVAAIALAKTIENGYQGALMAPTEILASQHYTFLTECVDPLGIKVQLLTGRMSTTTKKSIIDAIKNGQIQLVIGTHALIQENIEFQRLGLVVTDEQHRFGVKQRALLAAKGQAPDVLVMTATPIPRTMALVFYADLDISTIRELPPGRQVIKTYLVNPDMRERVYKNLVRREAALNHQTYIVCPMIEDTEELDLRSVLKTMKEVQNAWLKDIPCAMIHGKMASAEKETVMQAFYEGKVLVLFSTTVIEVGVNVPQATVMIVENADRFGLSQLHQLRGRIGRGDSQSYCVLISEGHSADTLERLKTLVQTQDGFEIAERDLALRGPGDFFGTRQHGLPESSLMNSVNDLDILLAAKEAAEYTIEHPELCSAIQTQITKRFGQLADKQVL
ncbi:ATP-dependent DNA helicase RecG [Acetonema longum]|uniref:ATP-dependent DNA helicase RecG n=1 Tax=Acetonema longum DSM 6540 TaxID=1009370 RepID=F7NJP2_9FIRM|nr:ATP-dependent DNA helicase RecG [Acetonema longum]EGO63746.1 ATP-dependent DNA helicase RecG [Acetonema longum DSM 6540]